MLSRLARRGSPLPPMGHSLVPRRVPPPLPSPRLSSSSSSPSPPDDVPPFYPLLPSRSSFPEKSPEMAVDHLVIGAGVVGLAVARELSRRWPEKTTYLVERRKRWGEETSSRNSEVIHAGLYYPPHSLKTALCLQGREEMYAYCASRGIGHRQVGKLVVGPSSSRAYFERLAGHCAALHPGSLRPPVRLLNGDQARELEPDLSHDIGAALLSERTGIVSSHELMESLEADIIESDASEVVYDTRVVSIRPNLLARRSGKRGGDASEEGFVVQTLTGSQEEEGSGHESDALLARVVVNASGLASNALLNSLLRDGHFGAAPSAWAQEGSGIEVEERTSEGGKSPIAAWYCKGNYASYKGKGVQRVKRLIYPTPDMGKGTSHQGLGTHLTLDLDGNIRFGPDVEWLRPPTLSSPSSLDFWSSNLSALTPVPASSVTASESERLEAMARSIRSYLPSIDASGLSPDYAGIRPKLVPPGAGFRDFGILWHESRALERQRVWQELFPAAAEDNDKQGPLKWSSEEKGWDVPEGAGGGGGGGAMLSLTGIESPGLTSSLALAKLVGDAVGRKVWGQRGLVGERQEGHGAKRRKKMGMGSTEDGAHDLDAWG